MFPKQVFKAYDIRGLVEGELSDDLAYRIGRSYGKFLREQYQNLDGKSVVVGKDMRQSSPQFANEVIRGLNNQGFSVVDIGLATTPLFNFACCNYEEHLAGIMVTASHNPAQYNGFKMTLGDGTPVGRGNGMEKICDLAEKNEFTEIFKKGGINHKIVLEDYLVKIFSLVKPEEIKPLKIVLDAGNGMGKVSFVEVLKRLPVAVEYMYLEPDGTFPNHEANPLNISTLKNLQAKVKETGADFGFALDGDADRIGLVDEKGEVIDASFVGALAGLEVLRDSPGAHMLYDLRSSKIVRDVWEAKGAKTGMCSVGHALIKKLMKEQGVKFGSELSLHLYYEDMYGVESTDLSLLYFLRLISRTGKKMSEITAPLNKYSHSGEINFHTDKKAEILAKLREKYSDGKVVEMDGFYVEYPTWWFNVRVSNTEPVLRLNLEANTKEEMEERLVEVKKIIEE